MTQGKGTFINEVAKDRLWRDYVSREESHQTYWAGEAQFVKGSLSPEKKNILRSVDVGSDFDATILLGTARSNGAPSSRPNGGNLTSTNTNPNAPSNLLLRQLHMTAIENNQMEAKQLETLQNYKLNYSSRAILNNAQGIISDNTDNKMKTLPPMSPNNNRNSPISPNATTTSRIGSDKERTLNNNYCSYYAGRDIGIHHYHYSPPARSCQGIQEAIEDCSANPPTPHQLQSTSTSSAYGITSPTTNKINNLPPLQTHLISRYDTISQPLSPFSASRAYAEELEDQCRIVSPKRHFTEHGLLSPHMGKRVASASGKRGYGQRIASTVNESYVVRPSVELNEGSKHGYRKW